MFVVTVDEIAKTKKKLVVKKVMESRPSQIHPKMEALQDQQQQQQNQTATKVFTVVETRHLLKILMNPKTLGMFKDNKQSHAFVWNYIFKCMKVKFPKFAKSTRQCYKKYENLKGKYFEIKRAQMNGEQRPYWLYYNEMDYIISHFPGHRPRISVGDANSSAATSSTPNASTNAALASDTSAQSASDFPEVKPSRATLDNSDANLNPFLTKKLQLLTLIRNTKPFDFEKKSDGWESVLQKAQNKNLYPLNKSWLDFYYEIWISHLDDTISKWETFSGGARMVRYDETDKIMFDIIKDDWNEFGSHSSSSIRIPTLRTLPGYIDKLKDFRQANVVLDDVDTILTEQDDTESPAAYLSSSTANRSGRLENGHTFVDPSLHHSHSPSAAAATLPNIFNPDSPLIQYKQNALQLRNQFIKTKMSAYVEKHNRKCYKMDLELYKIEKELGLPPSEFTQKFAQQPHPQIVSAQSAMGGMAPIPSMHATAAQTAPQIIAGAELAASVNGANGTAGTPVHGHMNETFFNVDIKREMNFDDGNNFDFV